MGRCSRYVLVTCLALRYDLASAGGQWAAYAYSGPSFTGGHPVYASDGVISAMNARGLVVFKAVLEDSARFRTGHLNPRTID